MSSLIAWPPVACRPAPRPPRPRCWRPSPRAARTCGTSRSRSSRDKPPRRPRRPPLAPTCPESCDSSSLIRTRLGPVHFLLATWVSFQDLVVSGPGFALVARPRAALFAGSGVFLGELRDVPQQLRLVLLRRGDRLVHAA